MELDVEAGGRHRRIAVRRAAEGWTVTLDGRELHVELAAAGGSWSMLVSPADGGHYERHYASYEVAVENRGQGKQTIHVDGVAVPVRLPDTRQLFGRAGGAVSSHAAGSGRIAAPMPGRIVRVLVSAGQTVSPGQGLLVVEAMKMENEVRAPGPGIVADLRVSEGQSVEAGTLLLTLDPEP